MKPSVSSYSFQQLIRNGKITQADTVEAAAELGFAGIELIDLSPVPQASFSEQLAYAAQIRERAQRCGIEIVAYTIGANLYRGSAEADAEEVERICRQLDIAAELGAPLLRHDVCYSERVGDKIIGFSRMLPILAENARKITTYAKALGIRTCTENHGLIAQDIDRVEALWQTVADENYGLLIDVGNFACVDEDSVKAVSRLAPYAFHVHAKDFRIYPYGSEPPADAKPFRSRSCNLLCGCTIGEGDIPVEQSLAILKHAGYDGYVTIEYEGSEDCMAGISRGLQNLRSMFDRIK